MKRSRDMSGSASRPSTHCSRSSVRIAARVLGPLHLALVVGGRGDRVELGRPARADVGGEEVARAVEQREVLRRVHRDPLERGARLGDRVAGLQQVAHDERDREAVADVAAPAERERDRQARRR